MSDRPSDRPADAASDTEAARSARAELPLLRADDPQRRASLVAWLQLQTTLGLAPQEALALLRLHRDPEAALCASGRSPALGAAALARSLETLGRHGIALLAIDSPRYPDRLRRLTDAAPALFVQGDASALEGRAVAIVGARAASVYGRSVAYELASALAQQGLVVISGLARGVDAAAHEGALDAGGLTIAVQGCGLDRVYPAVHRRLAERIRAQGAVVGELAPGAPPRAPHFPLRNRLIAGLAEAVVVVEARMRSGSLVTARHALDQGGATEVMAVPGPIHSPVSEGPNRLIRDGARPVLGCGDILEQIGIEPSAPAKPAADAAPSSPLPTRAERLLSALPASRDELARGWGGSSSDLALVLLELELAGRIAEDRDGRIQAVAVRRSSR